MSELHPSTNLVCTSNRHTYNYMEVLEHSTPLTSCLILRDHHLHLQNSIQFDLFVNNLKEKIRGEKEAYFTIPQSLIDQIVPEMLCKALGADITFGDMKVNKSFSDYNQEIAI